MWKTSTMCRVHFYQWKSLESWTRYCVLRSARAATPSMMQPWALTFRQVGWHLGFSLSQTLFTSIYIDRILWPEPRTLDKAQFHPTRNPIEGLPLVQLVLRSYCLATIKACFYVHSMVSGQHYYEVRKKSRCSQRAVHLRLTKLMSRIGGGLRDTAFPSRTTAPL